jgi:hypothetical protein
MREHGAAKRMSMRANWALSSLKDWTDYRRRKAEFKQETRGSGPVHTIEQPVGHRTRHVYKIVDGKALTTFQMDQRWKIVAGLYPEKLTSLLDIGCCRGWFVIQAAMRPECEKALGIDVVQGFIDAANDAKKLLKLDNAMFDYAFLDDVAGNPQKYKTPYQTIVLLNTYHYMYWGSGYSDKHWADHDYLLGTLASICTDRIIFMSPLEIHDCPSDIARRAREHPEWAPAFTTKNFLETASKYFDVSHQTYLGLRPLYLLKKR